MYAARKKSNMSKFEPSPGTLFYVDSDSLQ